MVESGFFNQKHCAAAHAYFCDCKYQRGATGSFDVCSEWFFGRSIKFPTRVSLCYRFFLKKSFCQPCSAASVDAQHSAVTCVYHIAVLHGLCSVDHAHIMHGSSCVLSYSTFDFFHINTRIYIILNTREAQSCDLVKAAVLRDHVKFGRPGGCRKWERKQLLSNGHQSRVS